MIILSFFVTLSLGPVRSVKNTHLLFVLNQFLLKQVIPKVTHSLLWINTLFVTSDNCLRHNVVSAIWEKREMLGEG